MFFFCHCDSEKNKPAEISVWMRRSGRSRAHCRLLTGGRRSVTDGELTPHFPSSITFDKI